MSTRTLFLVNPQAGSADGLEDLDRSGADETWIETEGADHARALAAGAAADGYHRVVACGGDGTVQAVARGLYKARSKAALGVLPCGTGNDFARTLGIPLALEGAAAALGEDRRRRLDLIRVEPLGAEPLIGINVSIGGLDPEHLDEGSAFKRLGYAARGADVLLSGRAWSARVQVGDEPEETLEILGAVIANGRTCAGGVRCAPGANPEDGLLDLLLLRPGSLPELTGGIARLLLGDLRESPQVEWRSVRRVSIATEAGMWFNLDGEFITDAPVTFSALKAAIEVVVGPDYSDVEV